MIAIKVSDDQSTSIDNGQGDLLIQNAREHIANVKKGEIPFVPTKAFLGKEVGVTRERARQILRDELSPIELAYYDDSPSVIDPYKIAKYNATFQGEIDDFWAGKIDCIRTLGELASIFGLTESVLKSRYMHMKKGLPKKYSEMLRSQSFGQLCNARTVVLDFSQKIDAFVEGRGDLLPFSSTIANEYEPNLNSSLVQKWLKAHLTPERLEKWKRNLPRHAQHRHQNSWLKD